MKLGYPRTKIVATVGPACSDMETLHNMVKAGVNIFRINFSHGDIEQHKKIIDVIHSINEKFKFNVGILGDLCGPKIRIDNLTEKVELHKNAVIHLVTLADKADHKQSFFIDYTKIAKEVKPGDAILIDDGKIELRVISTNQKDDIKCEVVQGGMLSSRKGVNFPNTKLSLPSLSEHDLSCLNFALEQELEWIALSFVRTEEDIIELRQIINRSKKFSKIIAKIEKPEAVDNIEKIIEATDAVMVARGDLGIEIPMERVPMIQKNIIEQCLKQSKPVIIATQMMETMIEGSRPSRAEVNDVANSVLDGTDAVMLSGETSVGKHPALVVEIMKKIIVNVENSAYKYYRLKEVQGYGSDIHTRALCTSAVFLAEETNATGIVSLTATGASALEIASQRPKAYTFVFTGNTKLLNMLNLAWGVRGFYFNEFISTDHTIEEVNKILMSENLVEQGDVIINTASMPMHERGKTNMAKITVIK